jgi:hypothetical protein
VSEFAELIDDDEVVPPPQHEPDAPPENVGGDAPPEEPDDLGSKIGPERDPDSPLEKLVPKVNPVERLLWSKNRVTGAVTERTYIQTRLNYFPKIELYGILGRAVKIVLEADAGVDVATLMDMTNPRAVINQLQSRLPGAEDAPSVEDNASREVDAMKILAAFAQVISIAPDLLKEAYCVILNIPDGQHREWAMNHALVNIDDETGFDILETFIDQSWDSIENFFTQWLPRAARRTVEARQRSAEKRRSSGRRTGR